MARVRFQVFNDEPSRNCLGWVLCRLRTGREGEIIEESPDLRVVAMRLQKELSDCASLGVITEVSFQVPYDIICNPFSKQVLRRFITPTRFAQDLFWEVLQVGS